MTYRATIFKLYLLSGNEIYQDIKFDNCTNIILKLVDDNAYNSENQIFFLIYENNIIFCSVEPLKLNSLLSNIDTNTDTYISLYLSIINIDKFIKSELINICNKSYYNESIKIHHYFRTLDNEYLIKLILNSNYLYLQYMHLIKDNLELLLPFIIKNPKLFKYAGDDIKNNYDFVLQIVSIDGNMLYYVNDNLKDNKEIVLAALSNDIESLKYASDNIKDDYDIILNTVLKNGDLLIYASDRLKDNYEIVFAAVTFCQSSLMYIHTILEYVSVNLRDNYDIVLKSGQ
jgi:hypothetical protein